MSKATFPKATPNVRRYLSTPYKSWWDKVHGNFLKVNLQSLVNVVGPIIDIPQEHDEGVPNVDKPPVLKAKVVIPCKVKGPPHAETQKEEFPALAQSAFNKRTFQDESDGSHRDRCWKKAKPFLVKQSDSNTHVKIFASSSKTSLAIEKAQPDNVQILEVPHQSKPQDSSESVVGPDSRELLLSSKEVTSNSCGKVKENAESNFSRQPAVTMSVFYGKKVISKLKKKFIMKA
ncbi:uncharacterized protein LOC124893495 [Capsicum annuum]|uniref:uncharacterized protein LOC124893495 n=1 Tax=Capsicum annuum TaxID=4072 RepID=UPI001FB0B531|nr:uncharacterized protein LOC124893495 [Capsicum annuum]